MFTGLVLDGFFTAFIFVCVIPGIIEEMSKDSKNVSAINDKASGLYNVAYAIGGTISPIIGGGLYD